MAGLLRNKWQLRLAIWVLAPVALIYGWFQWNYPTCTFRYKMTAEVMTPDGLKTGSSVIEVSYTSGYSLASGSNHSAIELVTGEAVYVNLGRGKNLFVLLGVDSWDRPPFDFSTEVNPGDVEDWQRFTAGSMNAQALPLAALKLTRKAGEEDDLQDQVNALFGTPPAVVAPINMPMVGSFGDTSRPETFLPFIPLKSTDVLGAGYELKRLTVQITNEAVTTGIRKLLPWLPDNLYQLIAQNHCEGTMANNAKSFCRANVFDFIRNGKRL